MNKLLVILLLLLANISFSQPYRSQHQYIKLQFSELMSTDGLFNKDNYVCYNELGDTVNIHAVGYEVGVDTVGGLNYSILVTDQWEYNLFHTIKVSWVKDRAGNLIAENNYAFTELPLVDPNNFKPDVNISSDFYNIDTLSVNTVWASGQENIDHGPEKAIDGISYSTPGSNYATNCWTSCCIADLGGQWFVAGFNSERFIQEIILSGTYWETGRIYGLEIQISQDNVSWETITEYSTNMVFPSREWDNISIGRRAKFVKINFLSNSTITSDWAGLWEIKFIGN